MLRRGKDRAGEELAPEGIAAGGECAVIWERIKEYGQLEASQVR